MNQQDLIKLGYFLGTSVGLLSIIRLGRRNMNKYTDDLLAKEVISANNRVLYLATILDNLGYEVTEFDKIAMTEM